MKIATKYTDSSLTNTQLNELDDLYKLYAYTAFNTSKNNPHLSIIKKCVDFKQYKTHKLSIATLNTQSEYTFLRLIYNKAAIYTQLESGLAWTNTASKKPVIPTYRDVEKIVDSANRESIVGLSLNDMLSEILESINNSTSVSIDSITITRDDKSLDSYIYEIEQAIYNTDPTLLISLFVSPREYFRISNYETYLSSFTSVIQRLYSDAMNANFNKKYHTDNTMLIQIAHVFMRIIDSDYLFLSCIAIRTLLNFIIDVGIKRNSVLEDKIKYKIDEPNSNEIIIIGSNVDNLNDEKHKSEHEAMYNENAYFNPYALIKPVQYLNLKLISEQKIPLKLTIKDTPRELYVYAEKVSRNRELIDDGYLSTAGFAAQFNYAYSDGQEREQYNIGRRDSVNYELMTNILTAKQKNIYIANVTSMVRDMPYKEVIYPHNKYTFGASLLRNALVGLCSSILAKDKSPLDIVIDGMTTGKTDLKRAEIILRLYNVMRTDDIVASLLLTYLTDEELMDSDVLKRINGYVHLESNTVQWFNDRKNVLTKSLRSAYGLTDAINDELLYMFYIAAHCPEFLKGKFLNSITELIVKNKRDSAFNDLATSFFKPTASDVTSFLSALKSPLMKDLFINVYILKAAQMLFLCSMTDGSTTDACSNELKIIMYKLFGLTNFKAAFYSACENLLITAYKSTNSFKDKIITILKDNAVCDTFTSDKRKSLKFNEDGRIALFADLLRALSKSNLTIEEQCKIANQYNKYYGETILPFGIDDLNDVMKAISLVPECDQSISLFYTEKYLQEH